MQQITLNTQPYRRPQTEPARVPMAGASRPWTSGVALSALVSSMQQEAEECSFCLMKSILIKCVFYYSRGEAKKGKAL